MTLQMSCYTRIVRMDRKMLSFLHTVPLFYKALFLFRATIFLWYVCLSLHCVISISTSLWVAAHCSWSVHWEDNLARWHVVKDLTQWKDWQWTRIVKIAANKSKQTLMSPLWCCCGVPGGFTLTGISVSAPVYLVKQNEMKAAHLKRKMSSQAK